MTKTIQSETLLVAVLLSTGGRRMDFDQLGAVTIALCPARAASFTETPGESIAGLVGFRHRLAVVFFGFRCSSGFWLTQSLKPPSMLGHPHF